MKIGGSVFGKKQTLTGTKAFPRPGEGGAQRRMRALRREYPSSVCYADSFPPRGEAFSHESLNRPAYHLALVSTTRPAMCRWFRSSPLMTIS